MDLFLLQLVAILRPIASMEFGDTTIFDVAGIGLFVLLIAALLPKLSTQKAGRFGTTDLWIFAFTVWSFCVYFIYFENAVLRDVAKMIVPLVGYTVAKNVLEERSQYQKVLFWMIVGHTIPILASVYLIASGTAIDYVSIWTRLPRWRGAYIGAHSLGHSMALFLIVLTVYWHMRRYHGDSVKHALLSNVFFGGLGIAALYCLYMSQTRSAILGLLVFAGVYLASQNRRLLIAMTAGVGVLAALTVRSWLPALLPDVFLYEQGEIDTSELGSGRPRMWSHNLRIFSDLPLDRQIGGAGIGNNEAASEEGLVDSHNDWLRLLIETGVVGFVLFFAIQVSIFRRILRMDAPDRALYLAMFAAVNIMMFVSNSYVWRIAVSQLYYIVLAYVELPRQRERTEEERTSDSKAQAFPALARRPLRG